jgi:hypothetical protein
VRQHGNFSFSRVYQAGHQVPAYEPEISYEIFKRAMFNKDIATGKVGTAGKDVYSSKGPASSFQFKNQKPEAPRPECYVWNIQSCTSEQRRALDNGTAIVKNYIVVGIEEVGDQIDPVAPPAKSSDAPLAKSSSGLLSESSSESFRVSFTTGAPNGQ